MGNDAAVVIAACGESAFIFGSSGGAQIGLNLAARYPQLVDRLIAHEPPCVQLLPDREQLLGEIKAVSRLFAEQGAKAAMTAFLQMSGMKTQARPALAPISADTQSGDRVGARAERARSNLPYFLETGAKTIAAYCPEIERLKANGVQLAVGVGETSTGELANRAALALASALALETVGFPGGHTGFGEAPVEFAAVLHHALNA